MTLDALHREIAKRIQAAAKRRGWTQRQLADFAGLGGGYVSDLMHGRKSPTIRTLKKIADALDVEISDLIPRSGK